MDYRGLGISACVRRRINPYVKLGLLTDPAVSIGGKVASTSNNVSSIFNGLCNLRATAIVMMTIRIVK